MYHNSVTLIGFLGKDPEKMNKSGAKVSLATSKSWKDKQTGKWEERTHWHRIVGYGYMEDKMLGMSKGEHVVVEGELTYFEFEDDKKNNVRVAQIQANKITRLRGKGDSGGGKYPSPSDLDEDCPF